MKRLSILVLIITGLVYSIWFIRQLKAGSDGAWLALGVIGTLAIYLVFSAVDLIKDRQRARWGQIDSANSVMQGHLRQLQDVSKAQGQFLSNQTKIGRLGTGLAADDLLGYDDALEGEVMELPLFDEGETAK